MNNTGQTFKELSNWPLFHVLRIFVVREPGLPATVVGADTTGVRVTDLQGCDIELATVPAQAMPRQDRMPKATNHINLNH